MTTHSPEPRPANTTHLRTGPSLFLDIVRLLAALTVALGHLTLSADGWGHLIDLAVNAVTAFFVLSGFVIRYVTVRRRGSLPNYIADRASRIYSVLLPAVLLAIFTDTLVTRLNGHAAIDLRHLAAAAFTNLTFTTYIWHMHWRFDTDGAMWSLCFEWFYYILYGLAFYLTGRRRILSLLVIALIAGPEVLTLLPVWLAGCLLFEVFIRVRNLRWFLPASVLTLLAAASLLLVHAVRTQTNQLRFAFANLVHAWESNGQTSGSTLFFLAPRLGYGSTVSLNAYLWGTIFFVLMLIGLLAADRLTLDPHGRAARTIRLLAEATFPLYLIHLPIFLTTAAILGHHITSTAGKLTLLLGVFALSVYLGGLFNSFKLTLRTCLLRILPNTTPRPT